MTSKKISVLIPVYNAVDTIERAVQSVLTQTYGDIDILICDNASTDGTADVLARLKKYHSQLKIFEQKHNVGGWNNFKALMEKSETKFSMFLAADDYLTSSFVEDCMDRIHCEDYVVLISTNCEFLDSNGHKWSGVNHTYNLVNPGSRILRYYWEVKDNSVFYGIFITALGKAFFEQDFVSEDCIGADQAFVGYLALHGSVVTSSYVGLYRTHSMNSASQIKVDSAVEQYRHMHNYAKFQSRFILEMWKQKKLSLFYGFITLIAIYLRTYFKWNLSIVRTSLGRFLRGKILNKRP